MPGKRYNAKRKRYYKRSRYNRGGFWNSFSKNYKTVSKYTNLATVWDAITKLQGLVNSEMHKLDSNSGSVNAVNTGVVDCINKIAVGDTYADRTGNSVLARALNIKGLVSLGASETLNIIRLAIVQDTQNVSDTSPAWTDIYDTASVNAHLNPATVGRFKILSDRKYFLNSVSKPQVTCDFNIPMKHHIRFNGTASTDIQRGSIFVVYLGAYTTNAPVINYRARLSFHDN